MHRSFNFSIHLNLVSCVSWPLIRVIIIYGMDLMLRTYLGVDRDPESYLHLWRSFVDLRISPPTHEIPLCYVSLK